MRLEPRPQNSLPSRCNQLWMELSISSVDSERLTTRTGDENVLYVVFDFFETENLNW